MKRLSEEFQNEVLKINNVLHAIKIMNNDSQTNLWEIDKLRDKEQLTELERKNLDDSMRQNFHNSFAMNELLEVLKDTRINGGDYTEYSKRYFST